MIFYHRTPVADIIIRNGFRDTDRLIGGMIFRGTWLSDRPLDGNEGAKGDQLLEVTLLCDISDYELIEEGKPYREWCVPAEIINSSGTLQLSPYVTNRDS